MKLFQKLRKNLKKMARGLSVALLIGVSLAGIVPATAEAGWTAPADIPAFEDAITLSNWMKANGMVMDKDWDEWEDTGSTANFQYGLLYHVWDKDEGKYVSKKSATLGDRWIVRRLDDNGNIDGNPNPNAPDMSTIKFYWNTGGMQADLWATIREYIAYDDIVFDGTGGLDDTRKLTFTSSFKTGYHLFNYTLPEGTEIPLSEWKFGGIHWAIHSEGGYALEYEELALNTSNKDKVIADGSVNPINSELIGPINTYKYGTWCMYHGIEYHAPHVDSTPQMMGELHPTCKYAWQGPYSINYSTRVCYPHWNALCASCGGVVNHGIFYAPVKALETQSVLRQGQEFILTCSHCGGMENQVTIHHTCKEYSPNRYTLVYNDGSEDPALQDFRIQTNGGIMPSDTWYYDYATKYEGEAVQNADTTIDDCTFYRPGYTFVGWAKELGGKVVCQPGQDIKDTIQPMMMSDSNGNGILDINENEFVFTLYAVWEPHTSYLKVDADADALGGGAAYKGEAVWTSPKTAYHVLDSADNGDHGSAQSFTRSSHLIDQANITLPHGYQATFVTNGGSDVAPIEAKVTFAGYELSFDNNGSTTDAIFASYIDPDGRYYFGPEDKPVAEADVVTLLYSQEPITLPNASKTNSIFVGWYEDEAFEHYVGTGGDSLYLANDVTLYARFSEASVAITDTYYKEDANAEDYDNLVRDSYGKAINDGREIGSSHTPDSAYAVQGAAGAVNISMELFTPNSYFTVYKPYWKLSTSSVWQSFSNTEGAGVDGKNSDYDAEITTPGTTEYVIASTGLYKMGAYGAQGGTYKVTDSTKANYGKTFTGGKGGEAYGVFYLEEGDVITISVGGQDGTGGGGSGSMYGSGGGYTSVTSKQKGLLLMAGGGGAATEMANGGDGGLNVNLLSSGHKGESGYAGGGGGYLGGKCGIVIWHTHTGNTTSGGPCYTANVCGGEVVVTGTQYWGCWDDDGDGDCDQGCGPVNGSQNTGRNHSQDDWGCSKCGKSYGNHHPGSSCTATTYKLTCTTVVDAAYPSYGGSNYVNSSAAQKATTGTFSGKNTGNGRVVISGVAIHLKDGQDNYAEILGAYMPDMAAPGSVENLTSDASAGQPILSWDEPESNGTSYDFKVEVYKLPDTGADLELVNATAVVTRTLESAVAGYYYVYDDSTSTDVASYVNGKHEKQIYTWTNAGHHYSDGQCGFVATNSLTINSGGYSCVHIAAVDVAGNIGPSVHKELAKTNLCRITFDTNKLEYQLNPTATVSYQSWDVPGKTDSTPAYGQNAHNAYYRGYYAVDGTNIPNNGKGTFDGNVTNLNFGGDFPIPTAEGCTFVGWNSKPDGSGIYYSADGSDIGYDKEADVTLILADITGSYDYGQEMTLYAIWGDVGEDTSIDDQRSSHIQKTYIAATLDFNTGIPLAGPLSNSKTEEIVTSDPADAVWSNEISVQSKAQFKATGVYALDQHLFHFSGNRVATTDYYQAGAKPGSTSEHTTSKVVATIDSLGKLIWNREEGDPKVTKRTTNGAISLTPNDMYNSGEKTLDIEYDIQGSYTVYGPAISREYAANTLTSPGQQGYPGYVTTHELIIKRDATIPILKHYSVVQDTLENYKANEILNAIENGLYTTFHVEASDYNDEANGAYVSKSDSAGIQGVYVTVYDMEDMSTTKTYKLDMLTQTAATDYDNHVLAAEYEISVNFYAEFPNSAQLGYEIYVVDNAGNFSEMMDNPNTTKPDGTTTPEHPTGNVDAELDEPVRGMGYLVNFSAKTVMYSDEGDEFNLDEGESYFQVGDFGHVEVWTIGFTDSVMPNFGDMGMEAKLEIEEGRLQKSYNMGLLEEDYVRKITHDKSTPIVPTKLTLYDEATASVVEITSSAEPDKFASLITNDAGIAYAQYYKVDGWEDEGLFVRIPPYYQMTPDGDKKNEDGTPQYKWELWEYSAQANKSGSAATATSTYILWDTRANDIHYRVTHES